MPIRKWDNLHLVTHNDMHIISVGSSFLGKLTEPYENLVRMLGTPRAVSYTHLTLPTNA